MYLKGYFCRDLKEAQLRNLGHNLRKLCRRFKVEVPDSSFNQFDNAIAQLDRFERIRYPEEIARLGLRASIGFKKGDVAVNTASKSQEPSYELTVDDLDALAKVIISLEGEWSCSPNHRFVLLLKVGEGISFQPAREELGIGA
jgi:hypothetical protein